MTPQEEIAWVTKRVAELTSQGCSIAQIAERLGIGERRVSRARERSQRQKSKA